MPAYDFRCTQCEEVFEVVRPMNATGDECCPKCSAPATRVFSAVGVAFKGTGFHNTDYKPRPKEESCPSAGSSSGCASCPAAS